MAYSMRQMRGLGANSSQYYREIGPQRYTTELTPYGVSSAEAPGAPQILIEEVNRIFGGSVVPRAGWGSGAQAGKIWLIFASQNSVQTPEGRGNELLRAVGAASSRIGGTLALPGQNVTGAFVEGGGVPVRAEALPPADLITLTATDLQTELARAGFNLGRAGIDGDFGPDSVAALDAAKTRTGIDGVRSVSRTSVTLTVHFWEALQALPDRDAPTQPRRSPPRPPVVPGSGSTRLTKKSDFDWTTWGIVGAALLGLGALWYFRRKKKRAAA